MKVEDIGYECSNYKLGDITPYGVIVGFDKCYCSRDNSKIDRFIAVKSKISKIPLGEHEAKGSIIYLNGFSKYTRGDWYSPFELSEGDV